MAAMVMTAVLAGAVTALGFAAAGHPVLVCVLGYVLAGCCGLLAVALQGLRTGQGSRA
jgi:hypothetical protein